MHDHGRIDESAESASAGRLVEGSPTLAMELSDHGALRITPLGWVGWVLASRLLDRLRRAPEAEEKAGRALEVAERRGWTSLAAWASVMQARAWVNLGKLLPAHDRLEKLEASLSETDEPALRATCALNLARVHMRLGSHQAGREAARRAHPLFLRAGDELQAAYCLSQEAQLAVVGGDLEGSRRLAEAAIAELTRLGARTDRAIAENQLGEVARYRGDLVAAERHYRMVWEALAPLGDPQAIIGEVNLAHVLADRGEIEEASSLYADCLRRVEGFGHRDFLAVIHACLARCAAARGQWSEVTQHLDRTDALIAETRVAEVDLACAADRAAELCARRGRTDLAARCTPIACAQWRSLGNEDEVRRHEGILVELC